MRCLCYFRFGLVQENGLVVERLDMRAYREGLAFSTAHSPLQCTDKMPQIQPGLSAVRFLNCLKLYCVIVHPNLENAMRAYSIRAQYGSHLSIFDMTLPLPSAFSIIKKEMNTI